MPYSVQQRCSYPGCNELVRDGRCAAHPYADRHDSDTQSLYNSRRWKRMRRLQLEREPWCADCLARGYYTAATVVDHVIPHRGDETLFFTGKLQSLCKLHHDRKTAREVLNA